MTPSNYPMPSAVSFFAVRVPRALPVPGFTQNARFNSTLKRLTFALLSLLLLQSARCLAADAPPLTHKDAQKILEGLYQNVVIGGVVQGRPNTAKVIAVATRNSAAVPVECEFYYDTELGWFTHEFEGKQTLMLRIATLSGVKELKPEPNLLAKDPGDINALRGELSKAMDIEDFEKALVILEKLSRAQPLMNFIYGPKKFKLLLAMKRNAAAYALANELLETFKDEPVPLNSIASALVDPESPVENPDLALAEKAALRAKELMASKPSHEHNARILDTLARIHAFKGDVSKAIEFENAAIELTKDEDGKAKLRSRIKEFETKSAGKKSEK